MPCFRGAAHVSGEERIFTGVEVELNTVKLLYPWFCMNRYIGVFALSLLVAGPCVAQTCTGDCDGNGAVTIDEIVVGLNVALALQALDTCPAFDRNGTKTVEIDTLIAAVDDLLRGCPGVPATVDPTPTSTPTPAESPTASPTATLTATETPTPPGFAACLPAPGMFADCFQTSGLDVGCYSGQNGAAAADVDGDGFPDVFFWDTCGGAWLFRSLGHGMQFENITGLSSIDLGPDTVAAAAFGDLDNDGRPDLVVSLGRADTLRWLRNQGEDPLNTLRVYHNLGDGRFEDVGDAWGFGQIALDRTFIGFGYGLALVDLNLDGRLDVVEYRQGAGARLLTFLSQADGTTWREAGSDIFGNAHGVVWTVLFTDVNGDHLQDLFVLNDHAEGSPSRHYVRVDRTMTFEERYFPPVLSEDGHNLTPLFGEGSFGSPMGAATGDLDGDGEMDLVVSDTGDQHAFSLGRFVDEPWGVKQNPNRFGVLQNCWSVAILDIENDGKPDLFFACARLRFHEASREASFVLHNRGGVFELAEGVLPNDDAPTLEQGLAVADFDQDGRLDLLTGGNEEPPRLLWNNLASGHSLSIRLKGKSVNAEGIGARIDVEAPGLPRQAREMFPGGRTWGYDDSQLVFGLGEEAHATVTVDWRPAGGTAVQTVELDSGQWVIEEP